MQEIFIATPTHNVKTYCSEQFTENTIKHAGNPRHFHIYSNSKRTNSKGYDKPGVTYKQLRLGSEYYNRKGAIHKRIVATMNKLRAVFLEKTLCPLFLSLESDVMIKEDTISKMVTRIYQQGVDAVTAECYPGFFNNINSFSRVNRMTLGCALIKREVIEAIEFRYEENLLAAFHDAFFIHDLNNKGFAAYYDPEIICDHCDTDPSRGWAGLPITEK